MVPAAARFVSLYPPAEVRLVPGPCYEVGRVSAAAAAWGAHGPVRRTGTLVEEAPGLVGVGVEGVCVGYLPGPVPGPLLHDIAALRAQGAAALVEVTVGAGPSPVVTAHLGGGAASDSRPEPVAVSSTFRSLPGPGPALPPGAPTQGPSLLTRAAKAAQDKVAEHKARREREGHMRRGEWVPPVPQGAVVRAWAKGRSTEVVGESFRPEAFIALLGREPGFRQHSGAEVRTEALLVPDPNNPHGKGAAVAVYVGNLHVGYLEQKTAEQYHSALRVVRDAGAVVAVPARVWASRPGGRTAHVNSRVPLSLPAPNGLTPSNGLPDCEFVIIPQGRYVQVTKEDEHMDVLARYTLRGASTDNYVAATLRSVNEIMPRSSYRAVQVEIDGERIGVLSKGQSDKVLPLVAHIERCGLLPVARAAVKGTRLKADVVLDIVDAETVEDDWLDRLRVVPGQEANIDAEHGTDPERPSFDWDDEDLGKEPQDAPGREE